MEKVVEPGGNEDFSGREGGDVPRIPFSHDIGKPPLRTFAFFTEGLPAEPVVIDEGHLAMALVCRRIAAVAWRSGILYTGFQPSYYCLSVVEQAEAGHLVSVDLFAVVLLFLFYRCPIGIFVLAAHPDLFAPCLPAVGGNNEGSAAVAGLGRGVGVVAVQGAVRQFQQIWLPVRPYRDVHGLFPASAVVGAPPEGQAAVEPFSIVLCGAI